jgi:hypothetical protein
VNCLDAETLAAWSEGGLKGAELAGVQAHVAGCDRCQMLLGAMARTREAAPAVEPQRASTRWLAWAVPMAAAATAIAIWVLIPGQRQVPTATPVQQAERSAGSEPAIQTERVEPAEPIKSEPSEPTEPTEPTVPTEPPAPPARPAPKLAAPPATSELRQQDANAAAAPPPSAPSPAESAGAAAQSANVFAERAQAAPLCGASWRAAMPAGSVLTAGSSPASGICWVVGRGGSVWRSTDGQSWLRINFPEMTDLSGVQASDSRNATVTTADGRTFRTADGGMSWVQQ